MGAALFSGPRMTGTLTGNEVSLFCLMTGKASTRVSVMNGAQYKTRLQTRVKRRIDPDGTLFVSLRLTLTLSAGNQQRTEEEIAAGNCTGLRQRAAKTPGRLLRRRRFRQNPHSAFPIFPPGAPELARAV